MSLDENVIKAAPKIVCGLGAPEGRGTQALSASCGRARISLAGKDLHQGFQVGLWIYVPISPNFESRLGPFFI